ncbi:signal peptidase I [Ruminococcus sp. JL13D9]|uniref:signal peptidase I n=1 Tax=Ruminococcus sp. JL13D9 TaxID=3233381 RepID=UPI00389A502F
MSDNKKGLDKDYDLAVEINPEMYLSKDKKDKTPDYDGYYVPYKADAEPEKEKEPPKTEDGKEYFLSAKEEGGTAGLYDWIRCIVFAIAIVVVCLTFVFRLVDVDGTSMNDTLQTNDKVIVTNLFYQPNNNDIVVISHGAEYKKPIIKRVIAKEGQTIKLDKENDRIIVDGVVIDEPYIKGTTFSGNYGNNDIPEVIPEGKLFVMGDNRQVSLDSRSTEIGLIDVKDVIGKAQVVAFPFNHFGYLY